MHYKSTILEIKIITYQPRLAEDTGVVTTILYLKRANYPNLWPSLIDGTTITRSLNESSYDRPYIIKASLEQDKSYTTSKLRKKKNKYRI